MVPETLVVKLFTSQEKIPYDLNNTQLTNLIVGQSGLGPKVFLVLDEGLVEEYVPGRITNLYDDQVGAFRKAIATQLARFHSLELPIERNHQKEYLDHIFEKWLSDKLMKVWFFCVVYCETSWR